MFENLAHLENTINMMAKTKGSQNFNFWKGLWYHADKTSLHDFSAYSEKYGSGIGVDFVGRVQYVASTGIGDLDGLLKEFRDIRKYIETGVKDKFGLIGRFYLHVQNANTFTFCDTSEVTINCIMVRDDNKTFIFTSIPLGAYDQKGT